MDLRCLKKEGMQVGDVRGYLTSERRGFRGATALWSPDLKISLVPLLLREMGEREKEEEEILVPAI